MNERVRKLKERLRVDSLPLCTEKLRWITESFRTTEGEPQILRRAKALAHVLDHITIFIQDGELIVGNGASKPMGLEIEYEYGIWSQEELDALKRDGYAISAQEEREVKELMDYWRSQNATLIGRIGDILFESERLWSFTLSGLLLPPWKGKDAESLGGYAQSGMGLGPGFCLVCVDYAKVLNEGLNRIIAEAEEELRNLRYMSAESLRKADFLRAVIIVNQAIIRFAHRFAGLASDLAAKEADPVRKGELLRIAETCRWVPANPARTFYEAVQSFWFIFLTVMNPSSVAAAGRFDQYMYPFYKRDKEEGRITDEEVLELLECLRIKDMELNRVAGKAIRQRHSGVAKWHNWTIGGVTPDGEDATNELTYLILEAAKDCPTPHHTITVRVHENTPEELMLKALEVVRTGIGLPAFVGDQSYIEYLTRHGVPLREARDYVMTGCIDANLPGRSRTQAYNFFVVPLALQVFMNNGVDPNTGLQVGLTTGEVDEFKSFEEFMEGFKKQLAYLMSLAAERNNVETVAIRELFPDPARSSLMADAVREGKDIFERQMPFENGAVLNAVGMINVADSLAAIKKLVFDEKKITMRELKEALDANWQGYEEIRQMCLAAPKYGNGDEYVDAIAAELFQFWADTAASLDTAYGGKYKPTGISISSHQPGGALTGATPDGRYAGEILADGAVSPGQGRDRRGPTGVIRSAARINQVPYQAMLLNMKFHPSALRTAEDLKKLAALIKIYFRQGGKHIQFNVVDRETLLDAQRHPERHRDLIVRVAGYSAYFVQLDRKVQDEIIARTEHSAVG